jgi:hypothetical protein
LISFWALNEKPNAKAGDAAWTTSCMEVSAMAAIWAWN